MLSGSSVWPPSVPFSENAAMTTIHTGNRAKIRASRPTPCRHPVAANHRRPPPGILAGLAGAGSWMISVAIPASPK